MSACSFAFAAATGARRGELVALRWRHVNLDAKTVLIESSAFEERGYRVEKATKTRSVREVTLDGGTAEAVRAARLALRANWDLVGASRSSQVHVLELSPGRPWPPNVASTRWNRAHVPGAAGVRLHDLCHWQATALLDAGVPLPTVASRLGHRDLTTTGRMYAHRTQRADQQAADVVDRLLRTDPS